MNTPKRQVLLPRKIVENFGVRQMNKAGLFVIFDDVLFVLMFALYVLMMCWLGEQVETKSICCKESMI